MLDREKIESILSLDSGAFIKAAYKNILLRDADKNGLEGFENSLKQGTSKEMVLFAIAISQEAIEKRVCIRDFNIGSISLDDLLKFDGDQFIEAAYIAILGRTSDDSGRGFYKNRLCDLSFDKTEFLYELSNSPEGKNHNTAVIGSEKVYKKIRFKRSIVRIPFLGALIKSHYDNISFRKRAVHEYKLLQSRIEHIDTFERSAIANEIEQNNRINHIVAQITELQSQNIGYNSKNMSASVFDVYNLLNKEDN